MRPAADHRSDPLAAAPQGHARRGGRLGLTTQITLAASTLTLTFLLIVGAATYYTTYAQITRSELDALDHHAALLAGRFGASLGSVVSTLAPLANNALILNSLRDSQTRRIFLIPFLDNLTNVNGIPVDIALVDGEGDRVAGRGNAMAGMEHWRQAVLERGVPFVAVHNDPQGVHVLVAQPVFFAGTSTAAAGALIHRIALPAAIFGADEQNPGVRLLHAGTPIIEANARWADASADAAPLSRVRRLELPPVLASLDLAVEVRADSRVLREPLGQLLRVYVLAALAIIGAAIALSALAARRLTRPLRNLEKVATAVVTTGSFEHRFDESGALEVSRLATAFNRMLVSLGIAYGQLENEARDEAEHRAQLSRSNLRLQTEVADRRRAEADAEQARRLLADAIENMTDGFALFDENRRMVLCNETFRDMFPLVAQEFVPGVDFEELLTTAARRGQIQRALDAESGEPLDRTAAWHGNMPIEMLTREGRWILARDRITGNGGMVCVRIDITERKHSEQALAEHAADLARSNDELEQFAYVASHDLQEPLRKVHSFSDLLEIDCAGQLDETGRDYLQRIRSSCARMQRLIDDLLTFSRTSLASDTPGPVDLNEVVQQVVSDLSVRLSESGGRVEIDPLPSVIGDPVHMGQLFQNLLGNALKYARPDVAPIVRVRCAATSGGTGTAIGTQHGAGLHAPLCEVSVIDNGIGFEQQYAERIFGVFQRLHGNAEYQGTGIGLAICRKIVERHGGTIQAISEPGVGTEIRFTLLVAEPIELREAS